MPEPNKNTIPQANNTNPNGIGNVAEPKKYFANTNYYGVTVPNDIADELKKQPAAELLRFTQQDDKTIIQSKLPDKGAIGDPAQEYDIRVNMNYLMRGIARSVMTEDGSIDPEKVNQLDNWINSIRRIKNLNEKQLTDLMDNLDIPEDPERRADFKRFLSANGFALGQPNNSFLFSLGGPLDMVVKEVFSQMTAYQLAASGQEGPEKKEYALGYQAEYEQMLGQYRDMVNMDPMTEQRVLVPMDSFVYASMNNNFILQNNAWRTANQKTPITFAHQTVKFEKLKPELDEAGNPIPQDKYNAFDEHSYVTLPVTFGAQNVFLSLEATAAPTGDLFHRRGKDRTGVGIYPTVQAAEQYHRENNVRQASFLKGVPGAKERQFDIDLEKAGVRMQSKADAPRLTMPKRSYHGYLLAHSGPRTGQMNNKQLVEAASKAIMASYFMNDPNAPAFNVSTMRKAAENLRTSPQFMAVLKTLGPSAVKEALVRGDVATLVSKIYDDPDKRYNISKTSKTELRALGQSMKTEKRSVEWMQLKRALTNPNMKNSMDVIAAVEQYTKGKKSVRHSQEGRDSFDLAMKALAIAWKDGDEVAKKRAEILADRVNTVRGARSGSRYYVDLEKLAPSAQEAQAKPFDAEKYIESLDPGLNNPKVDLWVKTITDTYKPVPVLNKKSVEFNGYFADEFKLLKQYDVSKLPVGGEPIKDEEFTILTAFAMYRPELGGSYIANVTNAEEGGFCRIPADYKPSMLIARNVAFTAAFTDLGGQQGGYANRRIGSLFKDVSQPSREIVYDALQQYRQGKKQALGKLIGEGVQTLMSFRYVTNSELKIGDETLTMLRFANATVQLAQRDPELRRIAEKNGMTKEVLNKIAGVERMETLRRIADAAKDKLKTGNLAPEEKKACVTAILRFRAIGVHQRAEDNQVYAAANPVDLDNDEEEFNPLNEVDQLRNQADQEKDLDAKNKLLVKAAYRESILGAQENAKYAGVRPTVQALGREGGVVADKLLKEAKINVDNLLAIQDTDKLLKTIENKELYMPSPEKDDPFAGLREDARQIAPKAPQKVNIPQ